MKRITLKEDDPVEVTDEKAALVENLSARRDTRPARNAAKNIAGYVHHAVVRNATGKRRNPPHRVLVGKKAVSGRTHTSPAFRISGKGGVL